MAVYSYYVACADLTAMKSEYPFPHSMIVLVNPTYPITNALKFYDWHADATETPNDDNVVLPGFPEFATLGRWLQVDADGSVQVNADWTAVSGVSAILNKPVFSAVAFSGQYSDLLSKPTIPSGQVNSDWSAGSGVSQLLNKPTLATVATSGSYNDLSNKPSAFVLAVGAPTTRTIVLDTAYQATTTTKPAVVTITLTSTTALSLSGGATYEADLIIGSTSAVSSGTGTIVGKYKNSLTGTLVIGLAINNAQTNTYDLVLPTGWYFAVRQITGAGISVVSAFDQVIG